MGSVLNREGNRRRSFPVQHATILLLVGVGFGRCAQAASPPAHVPQTGRTTYSAAKGAAVIGREGTSREGYARTGVPFPEQRFTENDNQTIVDGLTGLVWTKDANPAGGPRTWSEAVEYVKDLNSARHLGRSDWRLPNVNELASLVNTQANLAEWLSAQGFRNLQIDYYWTSTTYAGYAVCAWSIGLYGGIVAGHDKAESYFVWPVRPEERGAVSLPQTGQTTCSDRTGTAVSCVGSGQDGETRAGTAWPSPRFTQNAGGTVSDKLTGLVWSKDAMAPGPDACRPGVRMVQRDALHFVSCLNDNSYLGKQDWRLPDRNELASLVNLGMADSAAWLNTQGFSRVQSDSYWTSTSFAYAPRNGWSVNLHDGAVTTCPVKNAINVWPVRGGE